MGAVALTNGSVYTAVAGSSPSRATLLLRDGVVDGLYDSLDDARAAAGGPVDVVDITGQTALPGLFDCHVHLFFDGKAEMHGRMSADVGAAAERAAEHLSAGVTTVRELGAPRPQVYQLRDEIAAGAVVGARVVAAGPIVTVPDGHGSFVGEVVADPGDMPAAVRRVAQQGADCVKIAVSGGVSTPTSDLFAVQFTEVAVRAGVDTAHELGLHVAAHASNPEAIRAAARAGVDSIEHAVLVDDAALDALVEGTSVVVPTLAATNKPVESLDDPSIPEYIREKGRITIPAHRASIKQVVALGVPMAAGTDAGSTATVHGLAAVEAEQLVACGLSNEAAVAALTRNAASLLGLADRLGTLEPGKVADVVVLGGDPLQDIAHLTDVRLVVKEGQVVVPGGTGR